MRRHRRRRGGKDVTSDVVHDERIPDELRADGVRELCRRLAYRGRNVHVEFVRHCWPGSIRQTTTSRLHANRRLLGLFLRRLGDVVSQRRVEMGVGDRGVLSGVSASVGRHADRFAGGGGRGGDGDGTRGRQNGSTIEMCRICGMFRPDAERVEVCVR